MKIAGSIRVQLNCTICNQTQYPLNNLQILIFVDHMKDLIAFLRAAPIV